MDVTLVLTHRCNLACTYCYAGDHHGAEMDDATMDRALDLLYADGAERAQLSFFGGEPFLAFASMRRAVAGARARAAGRPLLLQCTTNGAALTEEHLRFIVAEGMHVTVSIDGVKEAHDHGRRRAGGQSSHAAVERGLRLLLEAGARPEAMMVISPATTPWVAESVTWLWDSGVERVRANLSLRDDWDDQRDALQRELVAVGRELLRRRLDLRRQLRDASAAEAERLPLVDFEPFKLAAAATTRACGAAARRQLVVGTSGNLYPCAPMVGEDRDQGPEAALRIGHVTEDAGAIAPRCDDGCSAGGACACAAYLETGDPTTGGENGLWYARVCQTIGAAVAAALAEATPRAIPMLPAAPRKTAGRRKLLGALLGVGGLALAGSGGLVALRMSKPAAPPPPPNECPKTGGAVAMPPEPPRIPTAVEGDIGPPPKPELPRPPGGLAPPPPPTRRK